MSGPQLLIAGGLLVGLGLVLAARAWRTPAPALVAALAQLTGQPSRDTESGASTSGSSGWWTPSGWMKGLASRPIWSVGCRPEDLAILDWTRDQLVARKLTYAASGLLAPCLIGVALAIGGLPGYAALPAAVGIAVAAVGWQTPSADAREQAGKARAAFRSNLEFFLTLVAGERRSRGSVEEALDEAAAISDTAAFVAMRRVIRRATLAGGKPWTALRRLGEQLDVPELRNLADIAATAADGAAVYDTLLASARTLRHTALTQSRTQANLASERMAGPLTLLVGGLVLFITVPFLLRMFGAT